MFYSSLGFRFLDYLDVAAAVAVPRGICRLFSAHIDIVLILFLSYDVTSGSEIAPGIKKSIIH